MSSPSQVFWAPNPFEFFLNSTFEDLVLLPCQRIYVPHIGCVVLKQSFLSSSSFQLQCRGIHRNPEFCLPSSPFVITDEYRKSPLSRPKEVSHECINMGSNLSLPTFGGFSKRFYSRAQTVSSEPDYESLHSDDKGDSGKKKPRAKKSLVQKGDACSSLHDSEVTNYWLPRNNSV